MRTTSFHTIFLLLALAGGRSVAAPPLARLARRAGPAGPTRVLPAHGELPSALARAGMRAEAGFRIEAPPAGQGDLLLDAASTGLTAPGLLALDPPEWMPVPRHDRGTLLLEVPAAALGRDLLLVEGAPAPQAADHALVPDPADGGPLTGRVLLVLVHGYDGRRGLRPFDPEEDATWRGLRRHPGFVAHRERAKTYMFRYRPHRPLPELGQALASTLAPLLGEADGLVLVGHSAGALVMRHAAAVPEVRRHVRGMLSFAGAHRGSVAATVLRTRGPGLTRRLGWIGRHLLGKAAGDEPETPALRTLVHDDHTGAAARLRSAGIPVPVNLELARFNAEDPLVTRLVAYAAGKRGLVGSRRLDLQDEVHRRLLARLDRAYGTADPIVDRSSALLLGREVRDRRVFPRADHHGIVLHTPALDAAAMDLADLLELPPFD